MNSFLISLVAIGLSFLGGPAGAGDVTGAPAAKRQTIKNCMAKQMAADRTVSYVAASRVCVERFKAQGDKMASITPAKQ